jgi:Flp pilus assembly protein TadB
MGGEGLRGLLGAVLETAFVVSIPAFYAMAVIGVAVYLNAAYNAPGLVTVFAALVPMFVIWARVVQKREKKNLEAQLKSFKVSPELHERALKEYLSLLPKKDEQESQEEDTT